MIWVMLSDSTLSDHELVGSWGHVLTLDSVLAMEGVDQTWFIKFISNLRFPPVQGRYDVTRKKALQGLPLKLIQPMI